jgi:hypothetical protein
VLTPSDSVLAAIIAGTATLSASFLQLRSAALREARSSASRRKSRLQRLVFFAIVGGAAVSGFAVSQWLTAGERAAQGTLAHELQARIAEVSHTAGELEATRAAERAEIEGGVLRRLGSDGITVAATVPACRSASAAADPGAASATAPAPAVAVAPGHACNEAEGVPVTLCATIPASATVTEVALFSRPADTDTPWSASRFLPGQESGEARFAEKYSESAPDSGTRQICQAFAHWSADHARVVRMLVRYAL